PQESRVAHWRLAAKASQVSGFLLLAISFIAPCQSLTATAPVVPYRENVSMIASAIASAYSSSTKWPPSKYRKGLRITRTGQGKVGHLRWSLVLISLGGSPVVG